MNCNFLDRLDLAFLSLISALISLVLHPDLFFKIQNSRWVVARTQLVSLLLQIKRRETLLRPTTSVGAQDPRSIQMMAHMHIF